MFKVISKSNKQKCSLYKTSSKSKFASYISIIF